MLFPRSQKFTSIRQSLPISNHSAETVLWNKQRCSREVKSLHQSVNRFQYQIKKMSIRQSLPISNQSAETVVWNNAVPEKSKVYINPSIASNIKSFSRDSCLKQRCSREVKSLHQSVNRFQYQIIQPRQFFETTLFPKSQKFTSIRQSLPVSNHSAETVVWNNAVLEKSKVYINPSIASNIKSISRDSSLKQTTLFPKSQKFTPIRQSLPVSNHSAETFLWNNAVLEKSKVYINPSIASNIKSFSRDISLKQRCSGEVKSLHQSVNRFQYQIIQSRHFFETMLFPKSQKFTSICQSLPISNQSAETVVWNNAVPEKSKVYINPSNASNIKSISRDSCLKQCCSRKVKSLHQSVKRFQYQINQPKQFVWNNAVPEKSKVYINPSIASNIKSISRNSLFEITLFPRSQKFTSISQSLPISNQSAKTVLWNNAVPEKSKVYINPSIASSIKSFSRDSCLK
jgi:hypothetical protein